MTMIFRFASRRSILILAFLTISSFLVFRTLNPSAARDAPESGRDPPAELSFLGQGIPTHEESSQSVHIKAGSQDIAAVVDSAIKIDVLFDAAQPFTHRELFSVSTKDREFMRVYLGGVPGSNINLIPHPTRVEYWILMVQKEQHGELVPSLQLTCTAGIQNDAIICSETAVAAPLEATADGDCNGGLEIIRLVEGTRDSRMFYGPDAPYIIYGAHSNYICFGQWIQDARMFLEPFNFERPVATGLFTSATELRRSAGWAMMEKNYFLFWDQDGAPYAHYTLWPTRSFARIGPDGVGLQDLAVLSEYHDQVCMAKYMPRFRPETDEAIHQATNSLSITTCRRDDAACTPDDSNTFYMHIFQHKTYYDWHPVYEPYVILFKRCSPFEIYAIGQRPFWIHGRQNLTAASEATLYINRPEAIPEGHTEMFYITSMSWKSHTQKNHGYIDDVLFLAFGIEDARPGIIDVLAGDLLQDLAYC